MTGFPLDLNETGADVRRGDLLALRLLCAMLRPLFLADAAIHWLIRALHGLLHSPERGADAAGGINPTSSGGGR
jgi:hypothetical protein